MSISLPPSYATSASSSSASSRKSSRKPNPDDPDKADLKSIDSGHSGSSTRTQLTSRSNTLKHAIHPTDVVGSSRRTVDKVVRRARCPPEYLEEIARTGVPHGFQTRAESKFRVVSGLEAESLFEQFVGELDATGSRQDKSLRDYGRQHPVVFAVSLVEAGRKVVDYYMTWRGKIPRIRQRKDRHLGFLDSEFRRVARSLDKHYRSLISIVDDSLPISEPPRLPDTPKRHEPPSPMPPPAQEEPPRLPDAVSATASVVSLPLLNMIRNVPFGNRQPLRVTNPDTASILSDGTDTPAATSPRILDTIVEAAETTAAAPFAGSPSSVGSPSQPVQADVGKNPKERHRSKSVRESPKSSHNGPDANRRRRDKRDEERKHRGDDDDSGKRSSKGHDKDKDRDEDAASEFTIVLLDDKAEKDVLSWHGLNRTDVNATPVSGTTVLDSPWTGPLVNANKIIFHAPPRPVDHHSFTDDESDESDEDEYDYSYNSPVIPLTKNLGTQQAHHPYASPAQPVPLGLTYSSSPASNYAATSANTLVGGRPGSARPPSAASSYRTAYTYPVHHSPSAASSSSSSSYVPAYIHPRHYVTPEIPLTKLQTPISYHSASPY